jgi:hypothetical protein
MAIAEDKTAQAGSLHYCEASADLELGEGFFRPESRPSRDLGVALARGLAAQAPLRVLDLMAGVAKTTWPDLAQQFVRTIISNGRLAALPEIAAQFERDRTLCGPAAAP